MPSSNLNLIDLYQTQVAAGQIEANPKQVHLLHLLEGCWQLHRKLFLLPWRKKHLKTPSVYIYGSVGSGKTFVMDLFFKALPIRKKARFHFHDFMEKIALELKALQGQKNPMQEVVKALKSEYEVICIDEMMVQDVVQAMLLVELLPVFIHQKVMLVMTSNIEPQMLYLNGLQRARFMVVINTLLEDAHVVQLSSHQDYRGRHYPMPSEVYYPSSDTNKMSDLFAYYANLEKLTIEKNQTILVENREVATLAKTTSMVWFDYQAIADIPRCQRDYLALSKIYSIVFISGLRPFTASDVARVILWMYLIDVFYDARIKLVIEAQTTMDNLYLQGPMLLPFQRTLSRMQEMQSTWYWDTVSK